jgi:sec-independent protein translocase protein TatB
MFDFSWSEMMLIGAIALVAIGPKDLPKALKTAGTLVRKARGLAREFHNSIDEMIRESELDELRRSVHDATKFDLDNPIVTPSARTPSIMTGPTPSLPPPTPPADEEPELPLGPGTPPRPEP